MTENWYVVLELEFDPNPVNDENLIRDRIQEKTKFWSSKANDFNRGAEYRRYLDYAKKGVIEKEMIGEANIRAELVKDACDKVYGPIDRTLKQMRKTEIPADTVDKMAKRLKVDAEVIKKRIAALGMKVGASQGGDYEATYEKYYKSKPQNTDTYNGIASMLESFHVKDLYEFLYQGTPIKNANNQPCDALRQRASEKKKKEFFKADGISGTGSKLCGQCEQTFKDDTSKGIYDKYLEYIRRKEVLDNAKSIYDLAGELSAENITDFIGRLTEVFKDRNLADKVFTAFCKVEKIPIPVGNAAASSNVKIKVCRCGCSNDTSDGRTKCSACGLDLQIKCPKCGTLNDNTVNVCKCGFKFENIDRAMSLCELASLSIDKMEFDVAKAHLSDAEKYWPGSERVSELNSRLAEMEGRVGSAAQEMRKACQSKNYYEAQKQYANVKKFFPEFKDQELEDEINTAIGDAEKHKKLAEAAKDEATIVEECSKAFEACNDYPGVREIISKYPPAPPTDLAVVADANAKVNVLSWTESSTSGLIFYNIVRKEGAVPISIQDGTVVGRISMCTVTDTIVVPGAEYYYAVFAERAGIFSKALSTKDAICNFFEIAGLAVAAGDASLQFTWNPLADNAVVMVEREGAGKKNSFECKSRASYVDKDLENDQEYLYHFYLTYTVGIKKFNTKGVNISGTPTRPPLPVEKIVVKPSENGEFQISWENPENREVQFFYSEKKPEYILGDLVPVGTIQSEMSELMIKKTSENSGTFHHDGDNLIYITAIVVKSGSAVVGAVARASKGGAVKIKNVNLVNGKILISVDLPKDCTGFVVLYKDDQFPEDISDVNTTRKYIALKQYQYDSGLLIDSNEPKNYYFSVFAEFRRDGEKDYSVGTDYLFSNVAKQVISYSVSVNKKLFGGSTLDLTFEGENRKFMLPAIDIMSAVGVAPMFKKSANLFYQIKEQQSDGPVTVHIPLEKGMAKETHIKAFLNDEALQSRYQLKLKLGSDLRIS